MEFLQTEFGKQFLKGLNCLNSMLSLQEQLENYDRVRKDCLKVDSTPYADLVKAAQSVRGGAKAILQSGMKLPSVYANALGHIEKERDEQKLFLWLDNGLNSKYLPTATEKQIEKVPATLGPAW